MKWGDGMTAFDSMAEKLKATGLYDISEGTFLYAEIAAYAAGIEIYCEILDELLREHFIATAESYGLEMYEKMLSVCNIDKSLEGRRNSIISAMSVTNSDFTKSGFEKLPGIFNIHGSFSEEAGKLKFTCTDTLSDEQRISIAEQMSVFKPCRVEFLFENN